MTRPLQLVPVYSDYDLDNLTAICQAAVDEVESLELGAPVIILEMDPDALDEPTKH